MTPYEKWKKTVDDGLTNKKWDEYDAVIAKEVADYNLRLAKTPGFKVLDQRMFKAILWVESGGPVNPVWKTRPMQIGNAGDPAYASLKAGSEGASLVLSPQLTLDLATDSINDPNLNVRAGIAYMVTRLTKSDLESVDDPTDTAEHSYTVVAGDNGLERIANKVRSTTQSLQKLNPTAKVLHVGQSLKFRKATVKRVLTGWSVMTSQFVASRYNTKDLNYAVKLDYVLTLFPKLKNR